MLQLTDLAGKLIVSASLEKGEKSKPDRLLLTFSDGHACEVTGQVTVGDLVRA